MCGSSEALAALLRADPMRMRILRCVRSLGLPDAWVAAGAVRSAVWDRAHGRPPSRSFSDVDVIWFSPGSGDDAAMQRELRQLDPTFDWSVKNQAHMHAANHDAPYASATDAMRHWPETATAVAARLGGGGAIAIAAPFGLADLFGLILRPTPAFAGTRRSIMAGRVRDKRWHETWPRLRPPTGEPPGVVPASAP